MKRGIKKLELPLSIEKILLLYHKGISLENISKKCYMSKRTLYRRLNENGIYFRKKRRKIVNE